MSRAFNVFRPLIPHTYCPGNQWPVLRLHLIGRRLIMGLAATMALWGAKRPLKFRKNNNNSNNKMLVCSQILCHTIE